MPTYKIIRYYHPDIDREDAVVRFGLTLEEAQAHCRDPRTRKDNEFFDGYTIDQWTSDAPSNTWSHTSGSSSL